MANYRYCTGPGESTYEEKLERKLLTNSLNYKPFNIFEQI